jgi:hypothetical protein
VPRAWLDNALEAWRTRAASLRVGGSRRQGDQIDIEVGIRELEPKRSAQKTRAQAKSLP